MGMSFPLIFLLCLAGAFDVPASGTDVFRPEILTSHSRMVKPGGKLDYATCSILTGENNCQVAAFLAANPNAWTLEQELTLLPNHNTGEAFMPRG